MKKSFVCITLVGIASALVLVLSVRTSYAGSATWETRANSGDWNDAANWTPASVPSGSSDTATFAASNITHISLSANTEIDGIIFDPSAEGPFTINAGYEGILTFSGTGITNNSGLIQNFVLFGGDTSNSGRSVMFFKNRATAGTSSTFLNFDEILQFGGNSTAGSGTFINYANGIFAAETVFNSHSTAAHGTFTNYGGAAGHAETLITGSATAGSAVFINNGGQASGEFGGVTNFGRYSTAASATVIANGGMGGGQGGAINFFGLSRGQRSRIELFGNGSLDISNHTSSGVRIGSLEGNGQVFLGDKKLTVGSNNRTTTFSGVLQDGGMDPVDGGSLTKDGRGTLVLSNANSYTGGTTINHGKLLIRSANGSGTGSGAVQVNAGTLGGSGMIAGAVTVGTGSGSGAILSPGSGTQRGTLTSQSPLLFNSDATYALKSNSDKAFSNKVVALGVSISNGALFSFTDFGATLLRTGKVFIVISNTAGTPIGGTFANLPDGSTFSNNGNTYQANYEGGDGNDLTLTILP